MFPRTVNDIVIDRILASQIAQGDVFLSYHEGIAQAIRDLCERDAGEQVLASAEIPYHAGVRGTDAGLDVAAVSDAGSIVAGHAHHGRVRVFERNKRGRTTARRAEEDFNLFLNGRQVRRVPGRQIIETVRLAHAGYFRAPYVVNIFLFEKGQDDPCPGATVRAAATAAPGSGAIDIVVVMDGQTYLLEVVLALHPRCGFADLLYSRQEQSDQDGDDGDHHQQLNQREAEPVSSMERRTHGKTSHRKGS